MTSKLIERLRAPRTWIALAVTGLGAALAATGCTSLEQKEREIVFRIEPGVARWYDGLPDGLQEMDLAVRQPSKAPKAIARQSVHAWWWPSTRKDAPALLYLHGSRWNLTGQLFRIRELHDLGFSVFAIDYRGFGKSEGDLPSEKAVYEDARLGWDALTKLAPDPSRRFIYGHSLGGAIAVDLASSLSKEADPDHPGGAPTVPAAGLVVESSFTNLADIARSLSYSWLPVQLLLSQKFDAVDKIGDVRMPVIVLHGDRDRYVPVDLGRKLFDAAPGPKRLVVVADGTHNNSLRLGERDMRKAFGELFALRVPRS